MADLPETRESLFMRLAAREDREAWERFVALYRPVVFRLARARGLQEADAQDLAQNVMVAVATTISSDRKEEILHFRRWLRRVAANAIRNALSRRPLGRGRGGTSVQELLMEHAAADAELDSHVELEYRRELYRQASGVVRESVEPETWRAYELTTLEGRGVEEAAALLNKQPGGIYAARCRVMRRLRDVVRGLERREES